MNSEEKLITEIFKNMNFGNKFVTENNSKSITADLNEILKSTRKCKPIINAIEAALEAQILWNEFSALNKSDSLYMVSKALVAKTHVLPVLKKKFSLLVDYFDLYSDLATQIEKISAKPLGVILVVLPPDPCCFILGATVPAALAAGCSVIVHTEQPTIPLFIEETLMNAGFPDGIFNVVTESLTGSDLKCIHKTIYCGSFSTIQKFYSEKGLESFKFFCPNNTAAIVLESCDLNAAVGNIFQKTWENASFWAVSTVVVQESIIQKFLGKLKFQMEQFLNTNYNRSRFQDKEIKEKVNNVILEAVKAGAMVVKATYEENEWGPTALVNYQNLEEDLPVLKILICRTPKEGVKLLNNCYSAFGTSIWTEFSVQALEIASQLESPNIWINCHGVIKATVPLSSTGLNGNVVLGGKRGVLEYLTVGFREHLEPKINSEKVSEKFEVLQTVLSARKAFDSWQCNKNKRKYFKILAENLKKNKEYADHAQILSYLTCFANYPKFSETNSVEEFFLVYEEVPLGVISLFISSEIDSKTLTFLIALSFAMGNAVILVMEKESLFVRYLVNLFNNNIQKNLLSVVYGTVAGLYLASDPIVQALWIYNERVLTLKELVKEASKSLKILWVVPECKHLCEELFSTQCIKHKVIWLPKVEKFP